MNKKDLDDLICDLYGISQISSIIEHQISKFIKQHGYSYKDIGRAVYYYVDVLKNKPKLEMGIGIVPFVYEDSKLYFEKEKKILEEREKNGNELKDSLAEEKREILVRPKIVRKGIKEIKIEDIK